MACKIAQNQINVAGFIPKKVFLAQAEQRDLGHGKGWMIEQSELMPLSMLWEVATEQKIKELNI